MKKEDIISLLQLKGVGSVKANKAIKFLKDCDSLSFQDLNKVESLKGKFKQSEWDSAKNEADKIIKLSKEKNISILPVTDKKYPKNFRELSINDRPPVIYYRGILPDNVDASIAVVGTRNPSNYGKECAKRISRILAQDGWIIVSGLALGIDTASHKGALKADSGKTIAIMAHGLGQVYPKKNKPLAKKIIENGGCLISDYPVGVEPFRASFVKRDRLQSGLSLAVVVVEASKKSGTMHTVNYAQDQQRKLYCVPSSDQSCEDNDGVEYLLKEEIASPLRDKNDIYALSEELKGLQESKVRDNTSGKQPTIWKT